MRFAFLCLSIVNSIICLSQHDTLIEKNLNEVFIENRVQGILGVQSLPDIQNGFLYSGKKSEVILVKNLPINLAEKNGRQIFAKIPGAMVYDMDGSGNQMNISTRGLDPHRSWEFNIRQNGIITNSDMYGYPASHYNVPMEAVDRIELVRGTGSLQYGAQFGGMLNYVLKRPDSLQAFSYEHQSSIGSFGLLSTFHNLSGTYGKWSYSTYAQWRSSSGYRDKSTSHSNAQYAMLGYQVNKKMYVEAEFSRSTYLYRIPGPLTDSMFSSNPRASTRNRNWYSPTILIPALKWDYKINPKLRLRVFASGLYGGRNVLQFVGFANVKDVPNPLTGEFSARNLDRDNYYSQQIESKIEYQFKLANIENTLVSGIQYMNNYLSRRQNGQGTQGSDYSLDLVSDGYRRNLGFQTENIAAYFENNVEVSSKWNISFGLRYELGNTKLNGVNLNLKDVEVNQNLERNFLLPGINTQYKLNKNHKLYGGFSRAYRPVIMADLIPATILDRIDSNLVDASGFNSELGIKGVEYFYQDKCKFKYDLNYFRIDYLNRIGTAVREDENGNDILFKSNFGKTITQGVEASLSFGYEWNRHLYFDFFSATSFMDGRYTSGVFRQGNNNIDLTGKKLEVVPEWISRNGFQIYYKNWVSSIQYSYVGEIFSDPINTREATSNAAVGIVPAYGIWDFNIGYKIKSYQIRGGVSNVFNHSYFTRRPAIYPGPGIWPSDGRGWFVSVTTRFSKKIKTN
jgi:Fe(3+) dicitrate transport protein